MGFGIDIGFNNLKCDRIHPSIHIYIYIYIYIWAFAVLSLVVVAA